MTENEMFFTRTMAKIHTDQGNLKEAAKIYRYLLEKEPDRQDLIDALAGLEHKQDPEAPGDLSSLVEKWTRLAFKYNRTSIETENKNRSRQ